MAGAGFVPTPVAQVSNNYGIQVLQKESFIKAVLSSINILTSDYFSLRLCLSQLQAGTATQLASVRLNDLLDYGPSLSDEFARTLVAKHYDRLVGTSPESAQEIIHARNIQRKQKGVLPYRYMQPKELPSSIAI